MADVVKSDDVENAFDALISVSEVLQERNYVSMSLFFDHVMHTFRDKLDSTPIPKQIEASYKGIQLSDNYAESDFNRLLEGFMKNEPLHAKYALRILKDAATQLAKYENLRASDLTRCKTKLSGFVIVGDLHGSLNDLHHIVQKFGIPGQKSRFIFNGDFVNRGPKQIEVLLVLLYSFLMNPSRVFLNRGNHEDIAMNMNLNFAPNFHTDVKTKYARYANTIFNEAQEVFRNLPIATIIKNNAGFKCFVVHGGISNRVDLKYVQKSLPRKEFKYITKASKLDPSIAHAAELLADLLWSDPFGEKRQAPGHKEDILRNYGCHPNTQRGLGMLFGPDATEFFCQQYGLSCIIRSHEVRKEGYSNDHAKLHTVFSASNYCSGSNYAAVLYLGTDGTDFEVHRFKTKRPSKDFIHAERNRILITFKKFLVQEQMKLTRRFKREDKSQSESINLTTWANIISKLVSEKLEITIDAEHIIALKDFLCPNDDSEHVVFYPKMFDDVVYNREITEILQIIFSFIDINNDHLISRFEAECSVCLVNKLFRTNYNSEFLLALQSKMDHMIDFDEFLNGFLRAMY